MSESNRAISSFSSAEGLPRLRAQVPGWIWLALPYALILVCFLAVPLANIALLSFYTHSAEKIWLPILTVDNYRQLVDFYFLRIVLRTLRVGATATVCCAVLGYPIAYYLARCSRRALAIAMFIMMMPLMVSAVVGAFGWIVILGRNGLLNSLLAALGVDWRIDILYSEVAVIIALVQFLLPLMVLPIMASIEKIPARLEEVAVNLGASPLVTWRRVLLPLSLPGLLSGVLLCFTIAISVVVTPALLGGRLGRMFGNEIYDQVVTAYNWPFASSLAVVLISLTFLMIALTLLASRWAQRRG
jgi:ABC-type spermidine/putrescine transport system permease subunit I